MKKEKRYIPRLAGMTHDQILMEASDYFWDLSFPEDEQPASIDRDWWVNIKLPAGFCQGYMNSWQEILEDDFDENQREDIMIEYVKDLLKKYPNVQKQIIKALKLPIL